MQVWLQDRILADSNLSPANVMSQINNNNNNNNNNNKSSYSINERFSHANADFSNVIFSEMTSQFLL